MTRTILSAAIAIGLFAMASPGQAASGINALKTLSSLQAQAAAEDAEASKQEQTKKKKPVRKPAIGGIDGESVDHAHGREIDVQ